MDRLRAPALVISGGHVSLDPTRRAAQAGGMQLHEMQALVDTMWSRLDHQATRLAAFAESRVELLPAFVRLEAATRPRVEAAMRAIAAGEKLPELAPAEAMLSALRLHWAGSTLLSLQAWERLEQPAPLEHDRRQVLTWLLLERWPHEGFGCIAGMLEALDLPPPPHGSRDDKN